MGELRMDADAQNIRMLAKEIATLEIKLTAAEQRAGEAEEAVAALRLAEPYLEVRAFAQRHSAEVQRMWAAVRAVLDSAVEKGP